MSDKEHKHPSYATVALHRRNRGERCPLFGSPMREHYNTIGVTIAYAVESVGASGEASYRAVEHIIDVELSAAQFAELLTTLNVADGVPCTIRRLHGRGVEEPPAPQTDDVERSHAAFEQQMAGLGRKVDAYIAAVDKAVEGSGVTKKGREEIRRAAGMVATEVRRNIPFYLQMFTEAAERIVTAKKADVDAWLTHVIHRAGIAAVRGLPVGDAPAEEDVPRLDAGDREDMSPTKGGGG